MNIIKNLLTLIIISLLTIQSSKSVTIIKNKNILLNINSLLLNEYSNKKYINENKSLSLVIKGKNKLNKNIIIFGKINTILKINNQKKNRLNNIKINLFYIGIKNNKLGNISYGKKYENINNTLLYTNIFPYNKNKINNIIWINNNLITYKKIFLLNKNIPLFKNIKFIFQYQKNNNNLNNSINNIIKSYENGWGITYNLKTKYGIELSTSYSLKKYEIKRNIKNKKNILQNNNIIKKNIWSTGLKFNLNRLYIGTTYTQENNLNKLNNNNKNYYFSTIIKYNFKSGFTPIIGYTQKKKYIKKNKNLINKEKYFNITAIYKFNKSLIGYINYKINKLNKNILSNINNNISLGFDLKF